MDRWTIDELQEISDIRFAASILYERRNKLNPYSPLAQKLLKVADAVLSLEDEKEKTRYRISGDRSHPLIRALMSLKGDEKDMVRECIEVIPNDGYSLNISVLPVKNLLTENTGRWYVSVAPQIDGKEYVGIDEYYPGDENTPGYISLHETAEKAEAASIEYAKKTGLPLFADYRYPY